MRYLIIAILILSTNIFVAQNVPQATTADERINSFSNRISEHILDGLEFQSVGPTYMGGRVVDVDVHLDDPSIYLIAYASGGLWVTENNGQSYTSLFDNESVMSIGDIAVDWQNDIIWIGSGENNSSRSSYSGIGMYVSVDQGKTWEHRGLEESHHIGRIILHPNDPNTLWVAAMGHLYSDNEERGIYKSSDGGQSWKKTLYVDQKTGAIDLIADPTDPNVLYAAMWQRERKAWDFTESGSGSGIYKSEDGGETWSLVTNDQSGFPNGDGLGRIGLSISKQNPKKIYAVLDNQFRRDKEDKDEDGLSKDELKEMSKADFLALDKKEIADYLKDNAFPKKYTADSVIFMVKAGTIQVRDLAIYLEDANRMLFDTKVIGAEVYLSEDGGKSWTKTHEGYIDDLVHSYGYYFGQIRVSPQDDEKIYITGVPLLKSTDGGKTFKSVNGDNQHVDHHALWINPKNDKHLINGNDGGINISRDEGENWLKVKSPPVGQFYTINVDNAKPYNIYGGLQDNGVWKGPSTYKESMKWQAWGKYPYSPILWGDGFKIEIDNRDNNTTYTGYQFGHYFRFKTSGGRKHKVTPRHELGERPLRFNWQTPIHLSRHNQDILYFGSNKFHRSLDKGNTYDHISVDLTKGGKKGDVAYGTLTCIHESPLVFGKLYVGTDDGNIWRSDDIGYHWESLNKGLPEDMWVTSVQASNHDTNRVYLALNGYRWDHFDAYIYLSENGGNDWKRLGLDLPKEPVNVLKEDPVNENVLYLGTDHGLYISVDRGEHFYYVSNGIPAVAVHDLVIQKREKHLLVATHGRSIYRANVKELQKLNENVMDQGIHLFSLSSVKYRSAWGKQYNQWREVDEPEYKIPVYVKSGGDYHLKVSGDKLTIHDAVVTLKAGLNYIVYHLEVDADVWDKYKKSLDQEKWSKAKAGDNEKYYLRPGKYDVELSGNGFSESKTLKIEDKKKN